jgi:glycosyltransferase involved in cell wall biosynthesis
LRWGQAGYQFAPSDKARKLVPLKIIQVVHAFPPDIGGIEAHVYNLSKELAKKGHEVTVVTTNAKGAPSREEKDGFTIIRHWSLPLPMFSSVRLTPFLPLRLMRMDADIYHSHGYGSTQPFFTSLAALVTHKPFIFTVHGYPKLKGLSGLFKWLYTNFPARIFLRIAKKVITVTEATIPDIEKEVQKGKVVAIQNGADFSRFSPKTPLSATKGKKIAYIGRFDAYKGIDTLIRAFAKVKKSHPDAELLLIGKDEGIADSLKALAKGLGVEISFSKAKPEAMHEIYDSLSVVVLPSKYEGLSLVLLEAIASGRPMLSTPVGAAPRVFGEAYGDDAKKFLFEIGDDHELAHKIEDILNDKKDFEGICANARKNLQRKYSWEAAAELTLKVYEGARK